MAGYYSAHATELRAEHTHPFFWAGFVVIGDGDGVVPLEERGASRRWILIAALTTAVIIGWVVMRGRGTVEA